MMSRFHRRSDEHVDVVAEQLERVLAFDAGHRLFDVVLNVLREVEVDAGIFLAARAPWPDESILSREAAAATARGFRSARNSMLLKVVTSVPSSGRPICETTCVTSGYFRADFANLVGHLRSGFKGNILRKCGANPEIALFERGHEFAAQKEENQPATSATPGAIQRNRRAHGALQERAAKGDEAMCGARFRCARCRADSGRRIQERENRRKDHGEDQGAGERESVGFRHGREDLSGNSLHGEERNQRDEDDEHGKQHRAAASAVARRESARSYPRFPPLPRDLR